MYITPFPKAGNRSCHLHGAWVHLRFNQHPVSPRITQSFHQQAAWRSSCLSACLTAHVRFAFFDSTVWQELTWGLELEGQSHLR